MANVIEDQIVAAAAAKTIVNGSGTVYAIKGEITPDTPATEMAGYLKDMKVITPGLVLEAGQQVKFIGFVGANVNSSGVRRPAQNAAFKTPAASRNAIYALIEVNGKESKMLIENLLNPVTLTGIGKTDEAADGTNVMDAILAAQKDEASFQPLGATSLATVLGWKGQTRTVTHAIRNYSREVLNGTEVIKGLSSFWFSKEPV